MFTGLVQAVGRVVDLRERRLVLEDPAAWPGESWDLGESIAVNGCCLTLVGSEGGLSFDLSEETLERTTLGSLRQGSVVNMERSLRLGDRLGGHMVQGHVDGRGRCLSVEEQEGSWSFRFLSPGGGHRLADKGSVCVDGVSLTVVEPRGDEFSVAVIPHTFQVTNLGRMKPGDEVNIEHDILVKHVERLLAFLPAGQQLGRTPSAD